MAKKKTKKVQDNFSQVFNKDCIEGLEFMQRSVKPPHLVIADPPYNIGKEYADYNDKKPEESYLNWCAEWIEEIHHTLHKHGSFWIVINDEYACQLDTLARAQGFYRRNWVIWYYTFGVACQRQFSRSHTHLFYYTKTKTKFTFNADDIRVPSARQLVYNDKRASPKGKLPDDTWILRPQDHEEGFDPMEDTWFFNRICGNYKERQKHSPNQLPLAMMERIVLACSNEGDLVCDPFGGTFTTGVAAARHKRDFVGFDISKQCCTEGEKRIKQEGIVFHD